MSVVLFLFIEKTIGIRVSEEVEDAGLDVSEHGIDYILPLLPNRTADAKRLDAHSRKMEELPQQASSNPPASNPPASNSVHPDFSSCEQRHLAACAALTSSLMMQSIRRFHRRQTTDPGCWLGAPARLERRTVE
eukprot:236511-Hanusia_phi.AAC.1